MVVFLQYKISFGLLWQSFPIYHYKVSEWSQKHNADHEEDTG